MNRQTDWSTPKKLLLSIFFGLASLLLAPFGILVHLGDIPVDIPWVQIFPILVAMSFGWRYALVTGLSGAAFFPFLLWPEDGWANITTCFVFLSMFILLGLAQENDCFKRITSQPLRVALALSIYIILNSVYTVFFFNVMLGLNPAFWKVGSLTYIPPDIVLGFAFKDCINVIVLTMTADTLLRLPLTRKMLGMPIPDAMENNTPIFISTLFIPVVVWLAFIGLGFTLLRGTHVLQYEHKSFALLVILANGFLVSRLLFHFSEKQYEQRKKYELAIETKNQKLVLQNKELEQFAYIASHDLQEPLQTLTSVSSLLKEEYKDKLNHPGDTYLDFIMQSSQRMRELVKGLLEYARIGKTGEAVAVNTNQLVIDILADMASIIEAKSARITADHLPVVHGYASELRQLFQNLLSNAIKFSKKEVPPKIHISAKKQADRWLFSMQDNGIGIEKKDMDKIFVIFKRLHNRNEYEGTGIGLAHGKKIISLHEGDLWVDSKLGEGSIFYFTIPIEKTS
ncbi:MAG TPA: ATP-binding protein [Cytophagaceae bacterium]|jgi:signal transduction histidine kinase|nr:ATP-binding protein [Cytophagaceae bacterium]